jgi:DNA-binding HxlR family transcriptional regulator
MVTTHPPTSLTSHCPIRDVLSVIGDKWTAEVMFFLAQGTQRLSTLQRAIPDASKKMLIQTLRKLEHDGLVERTVYPVVPPKAEYRLTPLGHHMLDPIMWLCHWAMAHQEVLAEVQA